MLMTMEISSRFKTFLTNGDHVFDVWSHEELKKEIILRNVEKGPKKYLDRPMHELKYYGKSTGLICSKPSSRLAKI